MSRQTYVFRDGKLIPKHLAPRLEVQRSHLPAPRIISDAVEVTSMLDGKTYTSKAALRSTYRAAGVEEVGNEPPRMGPSEITTPGDVGHDLKAAFSQHT